MKIVAFGIHPDDIELGCGGTVAICRRVGNDVVLVDLTRGEASTNGTPELRAQEAKEAARILGCDTRLNAGLPDKGVRADSESQIRTVTGIIRAQRPDIVIYPTCDDPHPDHVAGGDLIRRSIELAPDSEYATDGDEQTWDGIKSMVYGVRRDVRADVVVDITEVINEKRRAIQAHASQFERGKDSRPTAINSRDFMEMIVARDRGYGGQFGVRYGEGFSTDESIELGNLNVFKTDVS